MKNMNLFSSHSEYPTNWKKIEGSFWPYIAGFIDGDGSLFARIVPEKNDIKYKITVNIGLYQHKKHIHFLKEITKLFNGRGHLRVRSKEQMADFQISDKRYIKLFLTKIYPYLKLKSPQAKLILEIIKDYEELKNKNSLNQKQAAFLEVCKKIDKVAFLNNSKKRIHTYESVKVIFSTTCRDLKI